MSATVVDPTRRARYARFLRFGLVGASGLVVNQLALWFFTEVTGIHYLVSAILATQCSTVWNFALTESWVFRGGAQGRGRRFLWFALVNEVWLALRGPFLYLLTDVAGVHYLISNFVVLGAATGLRFVVADGLIWSDETELDLMVGEEVEPVTWPFLYDIHGIIGIASERQLPELAYFHVVSLASDPDIEVRVEGAAFGWPRRRPLIETDDHGNVRYIEHLGRFGFAMSVEPGAVTRVEVSPLVGKSPHVLYTNVVEPLLRWAFVRKGYALIHAACLAIDGRGALITAQTDTGKTTTCLMSVNEHGTGFVSDDMVIVSKHGTALTFPKPLTISAHTLNAVRSAPLPTGRRLWLQLQSRLHSRTGRQAGMALSRANLPVCTMNAWVQRLIPPPKFHINELIPGARITESIDITHMAVIERGNTLVQPLFDLDQTEETLRANTEDAYGFPPYPLIAHALANGEVELEAKIRRSILDGVAVTRIRTSDRHWYEQLLLVATDAPFAAQVPLLRHLENGAAVLDLGRADTPAPLSSVTDPAFAGERTGGTGARGRPAALD